MCKWKFITLKIRSPRWIFFMIRLWWLRLFCKIQCVTFTKFESWINCWLASKNANVFFIKLSSSKWIHDFKPAKVRSFRKQIIRDFPILAIGFSEEMRRHEMWVFMCSIKSELRHNKNWLDLNWLEKKHSNYTKTILVYHQMIVCHAQSVKFSPENDNIQSNFVNLASLICKSRHWRN